MISPDAKIKIQNFGRFLSNMVMPNIGAFIAWGFITALFIPTGWLPNETLAQLVGPMVTYLLPLLIGYTGGKLVGGERGAVVGAITTMGVIVGTDIPMFMGAMIVGPMGGLAIKKFDQAVDGKVKSGFEMLVNNFSAGIIGMLCAILAFFLIGPFVKVISGGLAAGVNALVNAGLLPLTSIFVEPAKILFLNNAINHGIFSPLGIQQANEMGQSLFFLIESNPGPGLGILLAYMVFGKGTAKQTAGGASIIHFFGGIHEIYFPYILMNPRLILAAIAGGMTGVFVITAFNAGLVSPASPGSIFAILLMTPKASIIGVALSVISATAVSFAVAALLLKTQNVQDEDESTTLAKAKTKMQGMKSGGNATTPAALVNEDKNDINMIDVKRIIVACDAGMGSSAMGASLLRKKVSNAGLDIHVTNCAINNLPEDVDIVITHKDLTDRARKHAANAKHISLVNFLDSDLYTQLVAQMTPETALDAANDDQYEPIKAANDDNFEAAETAQTPVFQIEAKNIHLGLTATDKQQAIQFAGEQLVALGYAEEDYIPAMFEREAMVPTYLGESIAVPHGTIEAKDRVKKTGIVICQYQAGVKFSDDEDDVAHLVIGIAAKNNEHMDVISTITNALDDPNAIERLSNTNDINEVLEILAGKQAA
ncbi:PTS mannitol transporter subunit IICBA [Motilimonas pumila]|uniref:PTS system mannitol-specific EIICBA component n=1 Tax=Motilimonas pumila TaxID=2303987 RepID=A0A418YKV4_9GAMM|nr:PTS mannitol transporter subunit IICBA [Motilimonas pumila]RJG51606.1 PTS mannitol transporter subunit IICBA [Motilimonas pumila]